MSTIRDYQLREQAKAAQKEDKIEAIRAVIISLDGSTSPANLPNYVLVKLFGRPEGYAVVYNDTGIYEEGSPIWVGRDPTRGGEWRVIGLYTGEADSYETTSMPRLAVPAHAPNHQYVTESNIGPDPVKVYQPAIQPLKSTGDGATLTVTVQPLIYQVDGGRREFNGAEVDLTSYVPASGYSVRVALSLDTSSNVIVVTEGQTVSDSMGQPVPYPIVPEGSIASGYVLLSGGQSTITTADEVDDARPLLRDRPRKSGPFVAGGYVQVDGDTKPNTYHLFDSVVHNDTGWHTLYQNTAGTLLPTLSSNSVWTVTVLISGTTQGCTKSFAFRIDGAIENDGGTTTVLGQTVTTIYDTDDTSFDAQLAVDDSADTLLVQVSDSDGTGDTVKWTAVVISAETIYV